MKFPLFPTLLAAAILAVAPFLLFSYVSVWELSGVPTEVVQRLWLLDWHALPSFATLALLCICIGSIVAWGDGWRRFLPIATLLLLVAIHATAGIDNVARAMGDSHWRSLVAGDTTLFASSILANLFYLWWISIGIDRGLLPVAVGAITALSLFAVLWEIGGDETRERRWAWMKIGSLFFLGSALHVVFIRDYYEATLIGIPFLLWSLWAFVRYLRTEERGTRWLVLGSALLTLAALTHGQNAYLAPIAFAAPLLRERDPGSAARNGAIVLGTAVVVFVATLIVTSAMGYAIVAGDIYGGGDKETFVPLTEAGLAGAAVFLFFSADHFLQIANILFIVVPTGTFIAATLLWKRWNNALALDRTDAFLSICALGYIAFITLFNFDLRFPSDLDLMVTMGTPFILACAAIAWKSCSVKTTAALAAINLAVAWAFIPAFLA